MTPPPSLQSHDDVDAAVVRLICHRFGDGTVYLQDSADRQAYGRAVALGLVSREGTVTAAGLAVAHRHE